MEVHESRLKFVFDDKFNVVEHDKTVFYKKYFTNLPNGKGVDVIADSTEDILFIEVKNCSSFENDNDWKVNLGKTKTSATGQTDETFDIEVSKKVSMSLSCLYGAYTKAQGCKAAEELSPYFSKLVSKKICSNEKCLRVIFFLEGEFGSKTRPKKLIMQRIQESIKDKLSWLNCVVQVVDSNTHANKYFSVARADT
jgi:hypothetical protein